MNIKTVEKIRDVSPQVDLVAPNERTKKLNLLLNITEVIPVLKPLSEILKEVEMNY